MTQKFKIVRVDWIDSTTATEWETLDYWDDAEYLHIKSIGYEIKRTKEYIVIALSVGQEPDQACGAMTIPMCSVQSIKYLKGIQ